MRVDSLSAPIAYVITASIPVYLYSIPVYSDIVQNSVVKEQCEGDIIDSPINFDNLSILQNRIRTFSSLSHNWDGYGATIPSNQVINNALDFINSIPQNLLGDIEIGSIAPTPYGTIIIDLENGKNLLSLEIGEAKIGYFTDFESSTNILSDGIAIQENLPVEIFEAFKKFYKVTYI